jgi:hypothetical protein
MGSSLSVKAPGLNSAMRSAASTSMKAPKLSSMPAIKVNNTLPKSILSPSMPKAPKAPSTGTSMIKGTGIPKATPYSLPKMNFLKGAVSNIKPTKTF